MIILKEDPFPILH